ncbi:hypothetical protein Q5P01_018888 [Channa striata]|uniref:Uncharacterized protein n=1 Tax=Channa striata TaxID=64152 RepID=A0AA88M6N2_CHASR|nr:hypothetical protein Q5P01_018888 [Channa striata]
MSCGKKLGRKSRSALPLSCLLSLFSLLSVCLSAVSLLLLLPGSEAERFDFTPPPDYDYNATFEYSFFSNTSNEELDRFTGEFSDLDKEGDAVTMVTTRASTEREDSHDTASLPVSQKIWTLIWTLMILNLQQLQHML